MCGIFAAISVREPFKLSDYNLFKASTDLVSHRGPNASGYKTYRLSKDGPNETFNIFFGHRRLSIIDLNPESNQPLEDQGCSIIYNGEIFNYVELKNELISQNVRFKTNSDTEVILKIYHYYGEKGFNKLNGMWAFIIYDSIKNVVIISRDRFAIKPLFYFTLGEKHFFSSELKQLFKIIPSVNINQRIMNLFLNQGLLEIDEETFIQGVEKLKPKFNMILNLSNGKITNQQYWDFNLNKIKRFDVYETFTSLLSDSIRIRLRSDVNLGALLSGGLDSTAISVLASKMIQNRFNTYTVISDIKEFSEEKYADIVVSDCKIENKKLKISISDIKSSFEDVLKCQDEPFNNFIVMAHYTILKKIKRETDITVVLSGQGGDEVLLGYLRYFYFYIKNLYSSGKFATLLKELFASLFYRTALSQWQLSAAKRYLPGIIGGEKKFLNSPPELQRTWDFSEMREAQINDIEKYSVPILTRYEDRNSMAHSLEIRLPFLDYRLVELLVNLDIQYKIKNGWNKYILRKTITDMPYKIRWRKDKKGFSLPESHWLKVDFREEISQLFCKSVLGDMGFIDDKKFKNYYSLYLNGDKRIHNTDISRVLIAEKWLRNLTKS